MPYTGKGTNTGRALQAVLDQGLDKNGDRPGVLNQVSLMWFNTVKSWFERSWLSLTESQKTTSRRRAAFWRKRRKWWRSELEQNFVKTVCQFRKEVIQKLFLDLYDIASDENSVYFPETYAELGELKYVLSDIYCPPRCLV